MISKPTFLKAKSAAPAGCEVVERGPSTWAQAQACYLGRWQFFLFVCFVCFVVITSGCSVTTGYRKPDGTVRITNWRLLWTTEAADFQTHAPDGFTTRLKLGKSATDADAVGAVTEGAVKALTRP